MSDTTSYDDMSRLVNGMFLDTSDVGLIAKTLHVTMEEVWEMLGYKDYFDFEDTGEE